MTRAELILIPLPAIGHLQTAVGAAKRLTERDERISTRVLVMNQKILSANPQFKSLEAENSINERVKLVKLPELQNPDGDNSRASFQQLIEDYKPIIKQFVEEQVIGNGSGSGSGSTHSDTTSQLAGFVVDALCTTIVDVADELNVPCYLLFPSNATLLCLMIHLKTLADSHGVNLGDEFQDPDKELEVPGIRNRVPARALPVPDVSNNEYWNIVLNYTRRYPRTKGMLLNSFMELESGAIHSLLNDATLPPIYPVGPLASVGSHKEVTLAGDRFEKEKDTILNWLNDQPQSSVIFLCFGSLGGLVEDQVREVAGGLERSGYRFLWSLRRPHTVGEKVGPARDYENLQDVLPTGFLDRTVEIGKIIGWAPQVAILSHPAIGGFVSHCGWNSVLEGLWFGVPVAAWPMYAEQQLNALLLVKDLELAVEIRMDYRWDFRTKLSNGLVEAEVIERGIRKVMEEEIGVRKKAKEMSEVSRKCIMEGGSSYAWLGRFIEDVINNIPH